MHDDQPVTLSLRTKLAMWVAFFAIIGTCGLFVSWFVRSVMPHWLAVALGVCAISVSVYVYGGDLIRWWRRRSAVDRRVVRKHDLDAGPRGRRLSRSAD